jgi:hypothetical protein
MRDIKAFVREHVEPLGLPANQQVKIAEELSAQLEEIYESLLARGMSADDAWRELESQVPSWQELRDELVRAEPVGAAVVRIEHSRLLGSTVRQVFALVLREGLVLVAFGLVLGVAGIALLGRALQGLVYGVAPTDPVLIVIAALVLAGTALAASVLPARRATQVNPIVVLNAQ